MGLQIVPLQAASSLGHGQAVTREKETRERENSVAAGRTEQPMALLAVSAGLVGNRSLLGEEMAIRSLFETPTA